MTTSARARVGKKLFRTAVVIAEPTVHGTSSSVKRFVDMHPNARGTDRKSTRLNSSHGYISYAVFCLKKKKTNHQPAIAHFPNHTSHTHQLPRDARPQHTTL